MGTKDDVLLKVQEYGTKESFPDLDSGWSWVVMMASFMALVVIGGTNYSVGLVHTVLLDKYNESQTNTAWVGAVHSSISNLAAPLSSLLIDQFSVRVAMTVGGLLYTVGFVSTAFAPSLGISVFTCGVVAGLGGAAGWTASMVAPSFYFEKFRSLAQGISLAGIGAGMFGVPPLASWVAEKYGSFGFFVTLGCVSAQFIVCAMAIRPSSLEIHSQHVRRYNSNIRGKCGGILLNYINLLTTRSVVCYSLSMLTYGFGMYVIFVYLPIYCIQQGTSEKQAAYVISVCGMASIFGRIIAGLLANFKIVNEILMYSGSLTLLSVITLLGSLYTRTISGQLGYGVLFGLFFGCPYVTITPINLSFLGMGHISAAIGIELSACGIGGVIGPILAAMVVDSGGSFDDVFILAGISIGLSAVLGFVPYFFHERHQEISNITATVDFKENADQSQVSEYMSKPDDDNHVTLLACELREPD